MAERIFIVKFEGQCKIALDDEVIDRVDDEWRKYLYPLDTPEEIAAHIASNMVINKWRLSQLDGWADMDNNDAWVYWYDFCADYAEEVENDN